MLIGPGKGLDFDRVLSMDRKDKGESKKDKEWSFIHFWKNLACSIKSVEGRKNIKKGWGWEEGWGWGEGGGKVEEVKEAKEAKEVKEAKEAEKA